MSSYYDPTVDLDAQAQQSENKLVNLGLSKLPQPHISGLKLQQDVQLGELVLNNLDTSTGVVWVLTGLDGWWTLPDSEFPDVARGWGDGSYDANGRYTARVMTLEGAFLTQDPRQVAEARAELLRNINLTYGGVSLIVKEPVSLTVIAINGTSNALTVLDHGFNVGDTVTYRAVGSAIPGLVSGREYYIKSSSDTDTITLSATEGGSVIDITSSTLATGSSHYLDGLQPKTSIVRISGRPQIETVNARGRTNFSIGLKAADPIKYEYYEDNETGGYRTATLTRNTDVIVRNVGNVRVPVIFSISGDDVAEGQITNDVNGDIQTISGIYMESADSLLEIDTHNRNIIALDGSSVARVGRKYADSYIDWIYLEPGDNELRFSSTDSTAACTMYYKSGWIG
jgi:Phage tail protein